MTRRRLLLATLVLLTCLSLAGLFVLWPSGPGVTRANFDRIAEGDTRARVEELLGGPEGDYRTTEVPTGDRHIIQGGDVFTIAKFEPGQQPFREASWIGNQGFIRLHFDRHDRVVFRLFRPSRP
jgi:hypothetical protein